MIGRQTLPLASYPLFNTNVALGSSNLTQTVTPYYLDWLSHPDFDSYWERWSIENHYDAIQVPSFTVAAWYDLFQGGSLRNYSGIKSHASGEAASKYQRLLVVIGGHAGIGRKIGDLDFGPAAEAYDEDEVTLRWYDYLFKGIQNELATEKPVKIFVMGTNAWREEDDWPLARAKETRYFLHSAGKAAGLSDDVSDGALSTSKPSSEPSDAYIYDPSDPVPTIGGPLCCDSEHLAPGPHDQRAVEARKDVLVYSTPVLAEDMEVTGQVALDFYAKSSAVDTDFTAKLVDVWPNGYVQNLTEGIIRARHRDSYTKSELLVPGKVYPFHVDLWSTSNVFLKGHKLRVEISSSNFPRFNRNLNTGKDAKTDDQPVKATNVIYHDGEHPSALILPIVPR
jgi:putative CocE/NonD family hydrolase